jgi:hypothetical protein
MLPLLALSCPQCSAPLPRAARWRTVNCSYCGATIVRGTETVERESFRAALRRANADVPGGRILTWRGARYRVLAPLATGEHSEVLLAERLGALPERVTLKLARDSAADTPCCCAKASRAAVAARTVGVPGAAYFTRRLPQPLGVGLAEGQDLGDGARQALVLRHPTGFWGSLQRRAAGQPVKASTRATPCGCGAACSRCWPSCTAPAGRTATCRPRMPWCIRATTACCSSAGRARSTPPARRHAGAAARDLMQAAWTVRAGIARRRRRRARCFGASTPAPLAALLRQCSEDAAFCRAPRRAGHRAIAVRRVARSLRAAAVRSHFDPSPHAGR